LPGGFYFPLRAPGFPQTALAAVEEVWDGQYLVHLGAVDGVGADRSVDAGLGRGLCSLARNHYRRDCRERRRYALDALGQLSRWVRGDPVDVFGRRRDRRKGHPPSLRVDDGNWGSRLLRALSRGARLGSFRL